MATPTPTPKISVVIPCYNAAPTLTEAIKSIQSQTLANWELIVVDDGSKDNTPNIVTQIAENDPRIQLVKRSHQGVVSAANHGMSLANAPLIARMDADDISLPDRLEKQAALLATRPDLSVVSCLAEFAGDPDTAGGYAHHVAWANSCLTQTQISLNRFIDLPIPNPTLMIRRSLLEKYGAFRHGDFPEDYELYLRWLSKGVGIGKVNAPLYQWHDPPTRLTRNDTRYDPAAFHRCKAPYLAKAITASSCAERELWIWGAGRPARKCARPLEAAWKPASGFIDIDPRKIGRTLQGRPIVASDNLPAISQAIIVSYVGTRGARDIIRAELLATGRTEGTDFWIAA